MILTKKIVFISMDHPTIIHIEVRCNKARLAYHVEIKGPLQNEPIKTSEVWSPKGFPNLAVCFILSL